MDPATGDGEPAAGIRASDAERDATLERLSAATGDGRLTLEEFSQRMDRATTAKTRAELDRLVADLPTGPGAAGSAVAERGPGPARARRPSISARSHRSAGPGSTRPGWPASAKARRRGHRWTGGPGDGLTGTSGGPSGGPNGDRGATASPAAAARRRVDRVARAA